MSDQPPDPEIEKLLAELRSDEAYRRKAGAEKIEELKLRSDEIVSLLKTIVGADENKYVRQAAEQALVSVGVIVPPAPPSAPAGIAPAKVIKPLSRRAKLVDFSIGFVGWFLVNYVLQQVWLALQPPCGPMCFPGPVAIGGEIILIVINLIVFIVLAFKRRWVAFGMFIPLFTVIVFVGLILIVIFAPGLYFHPLR